MIRVKNLAFAPSFTEKDLLCAVKNVFGCGDDDVLSLKMSSKSLDARRGKTLRWIVNADVELKNEKKFAAKAKGEIIYPFVKKEYVFPTVTRKTGLRPVVVGFGPAGIFCALMLAKCGYSPIILERGDEMDARAEKVALFNASGKLDTESNIQFGEGGAGAFSDGKLTTLIKDKDNRCAYVLEEFVASGAPDEILYLSHPHIGTDLLRNVIKNLRERIKSLGGTFRFSSKLTDIEADDDGVKAVYINDSERLETDAVFLCIGHSARDTFEMLYSKGIKMEQKPFSVGVRIEHRQKAINEARYHEFSSEGGLPNAEYKAVAHTPNGRALYTFCMCPGGKVVAATSEEGSVVTNGMSYHSRDGENANSALLVSVEKADIGGDDPLDGVIFQRKLEKKAFELGGGGYKAPAQTVGDFLRGKATTSFGDVAPTYPRGVTGSDLNELLPPFVCETLREGLRLIDKQIPSFASSDAVLTGVESRSTCPVRCVRDGYTFQASIKGLYPAGEGAGYAGGIMSAASDGIKCAEAYIADRGKE